MANSGLVIPHSNMETHRVVNIQFGLLNPDEIIRMSVCKVEKTEIVDKEGFPQTNGINDIRMGIVDKTLNCRTCNCNFANCPGHFGHIELARPMFHVGYIEIIRKILKCVCFNCSKLLAARDSKFKQIMSIKNAKKRQNLVFNLCKTKFVCMSDKQDNPGSLDNTSDNNSNMEIQNILHQGCGFRQPKYKRDKVCDLRLVAEFDADNNNDNNMEIPDRSRILKPEDCLRILKRISPDDCYALGFDPARARPDWMILTVLAVCPPQVRPSVSVDATMRSEDDLTFQYTQILKANHLLKSQESKGAPEHVIDDTAYLLQFYVATLMNNEISSATSQQRSGRPIKAISTRLKGKEGRLRGNLMGKRVDFSARTVITPDPNLSLDQLGVPKSIALNLTVPEVVTPYNIDNLRKLIENGPTEWPGAKYICRDDGVRIDLRYLKKRSDVHLAYGYVVERHMQDGDMVLFNRQPSLHKMSIMGHRVRILPFSTFRLNLSVTTPYNADFDGDEMNMHLPQSLETKAEISEIMHVPKQIVSPQSNKPVMGIVQDSLIGVKLFTQRNVFLTLDIVMNLLMWITDFDGFLPIPAILKPRPLWTGKQIFSLILPQINLRRVTSNHDDRKDNKFNPYDTVILIERGELIQGTTCKRTVGNASGGLVHTIMNEYGPERTMYFLNNTQCIVNQWLLVSGFTVGVSDIISDDKTSIKVRETMEEVKSKVKTILLDAQSGKLKSQPGKSIFESFEAQVNAALNEARDVAGRYVQGSLKPYNHLKNMVIAGSKGNVTNISQIIACVGQQNVEGKRIPFHFNRRTLPHFTKDDFGPESRGFVENSYLSGLTPQEFFFHAMGGREGLIDTAVKTSETGYIQRRLVKALEDIMVQYDGTVRNSNGVICQFLYGEDGMNGECIEDQKIETMLMDDHSLCSKHNFLYNPVLKENLAKPEELATILENFMDKKLVYELIYENFHHLKITLEDEFNQVIKDRDLLRYKIFARNYDDKGHFPVNIPRIKWNACKKFFINNTTKSDLSPFYVIEKKEELKSKLVLVKGNDEISKEFQDNSIMLFKIVLNYTLSTKRLIQHYKFTKKAFDWIIGEIESRFFQSIIKPGEMVGSIAAQSLGEPATQMTLNTFHFAGVSAQNVTLGVPRLKEVINVAKRLKTPSMTVFLKPEIADSQESATQLQNTLEYTLMHHITTSTAIYYDPDPRSTIIEEDMKMVNIHAKLHYFEDDDKVSRLSPWVLRLELDENALILKNLSISTIAEKIEEMDKNFEVIASDENDEKQIIRIRIMNDKSNSQYTEEEVFSEKILISLENNLMKELSLKGIPQIKKVYVREAKVKGYDQASGTFNEKKQEWVIETDGTNLFEVFLIDEVDFRRTISNDINEIYECLGVEAVRKSLMNELRAVLKPYEIYVNYRHLAILCDVMTQRGVLTAITRHGINRVDNGPLRKSSFEETVEILLEAGVFSETDHLTGITENIMLGQLAPFGTGSFDLVLDINKIQEANYIANNKILKEEDDAIDMPYAESPNIMPTPIINTPIPGNLITSTPMTVERQSPIFTPSLQNNFSRMPYNINNQTNSDVIVNIVTPNYPMASPYSIQSPMTNPSDYYNKTPYSPIYDEDQQYNSRSKGMSSGYSKDIMSSQYSGQYSPKESIPIKSPYLNPSSSYHVGQSSSPTYSPSSPVYQSTRYARNYNYTTSPGYASHSGNITYSPTTPMHKSSNSPDYGMNNYRSSSYSAVNSPKIEQSPHSPTYNPKSPSYMLSTNNYMMNSPYYNPQIDFQSNAPKVKKEIGEALSDDDEAMN